MVDLGTDDRERCAQAGIRVRSDDPGDDPDSEGMLERLIARHGKQMVDYRAPTQSRNKTTGQARLVTRLCW